MNKSKQEKRQASGEEGVITVSRTMFNQIDEEKEFIKIRPFATTTAKVGVKLGRTINLGNYESARIDVMIEMPCYVEEAPKVYGDVFSLAEERLMTETDKITKSLNQSQSIVRAVCEGPVCAGAGDGAECFLRVHGGARNGIYLRTGVGDRISVRDLFHCDHRGGTSGGDHPLDPGCG